MIEIYTQPNCAPCSQTKKWLTRQGESYVEKNIQEDPAALNELLELGYQSTPVIKNGDVTVAGFNPIKMKSLLSL